MIDKYYRMYTKSNSGGNLKSTGNLALTFGRATNKK